MFYRRCIIVGMENLPKKEAFVPEDKRAEFADTAAKGKYFGEKSEELFDRAGHEKHLAKMNAGIAAGFAGAAVAAAGTSFAENPIAGAAVGAGAATIFGLDAVREWKGSRRHSKEATAEKAESEKNYGTSRRIVTKEMLKGGAAPIAQTNDGTVTPELNNTTEQVEIAREEMNADLQARKEKEKIEQQEDEE